MPTRDWGISRLATHGLVLGLALVGAALAPMQLAQQTGGVIATTALAGSYSRGDGGPAVSEAPTSIRPDVALMHGAHLSLAPMATTADLTENLHHLGRFNWPARGILTTYFSQYHPGIDIANVEGTREVAADAGTVVFADWGEYGLYVEIDHGNGFHTVYGHMSVVMVHRGEAVAPGQEIGLMGSTGRSTGPHLHFEVRYQGAPQNPLDFLQ